MRIKGVSTVAKNVNEEPRVRSPVFVDLLGLHTKRAWAGGHDAVGGWIR